jgi:hypothetical protein
MDYSLARMGQYHINNKDNYNFYGGLKYVKLSEYPYNYAKQIYNPNFKFSFPHALPHFAFAQTDTRMN